MNAMPVTINVAPIHHKTENFSSKINQPIAAENIMLQPRFSTVASAEFNACMASTNMVHIAPFRNIVAPRNVARNTAAAAKETVESEETST